MKLPCLIITLVIITSMNTYLGTSFYSIQGEEFHDECRAFCTCGKTGVECANIECPSDFGLDVLDPHCIEWETHPPGFTPVPPHCCPEKMVCKRNGSCLYEGQR